MVIALQAITSSGTKKGDLFLADVNTQLKNKNITTDVKVDTHSNVSNLLNLHDIYNFCVIYKLNMLVFVMEKCTEMSCLSISSNRLNDDHG